MIIINIKIIQIIYRIIKYTTEEIKCYENKIETNKVQREWSPAQL